MLKDMMFLIKVDTSKFFVNKSISYFNYKLSFWARSGKSLNSILNPRADNSLINGNYQAYLFTKIYIDLLSKEYYLKVEGNIGDLINVGSLIFDERNTCPIIFKDIGIDITAFFIKDIFESNCFKFSKVSEDSIKEVEYDIGLSIFDNKEYDYKNNYTLVCYYINGKYIFEEYLYSLQYINNGKRRINLLSPQIIGKNYIRKVEKGEIIGLIPFKPDASFKFLTYYLMDAESISEPYIYECKSYPFCTIDSNTFNNSIPLRNISGSYSISYTNDEYGNISPIGKIQKILLIKIKSSGYLNDINIYTNENNIIPFQTNKHYKYLRKGNNENIICSFDSILKKNKEMYIFLSLEILSGSAKVNLDTPKSSLIGAIENENKYTYIFRYVRKGKRSILRINADKNTAYKFIMSQEEDKNILNLPVGNNFLYEFKDNIREYKLNFKNMPINYNINDNMYVYFKFFPINCLIEIKSNFKMMQPYEELISQREGEYHFDVKRVDNKNESCKFYTSTDLLEANTINKQVEYMEASTISNNVSHYAIFNKEINKIKYFYPHTELENNLMVNFKIKNETKDNYTFCAYINEYQICKNNSERENSLTFSSSDIAKRCKDEKQICNIYFVLETNNKTESTVEIKVISFSNPNSENFFKKNLKIILITVGGVHLVLIIFILNIYLCRRKRKSDLSVEVNQISFGEEGERDKNKDDESLLS